MSFFVNYFNYSVDEFDRLTLPQAYLILDQRREIETNRYSFWMNEFRTANWYTVVSAAGTKQFKKPSDLYRLPFDKQERQFTDKQIDFFNRALTPQELKLINAN